MTDKADFGTKNEGSILFGTEFCVYTISTVLKLLPQLHFLDIMVFYIVNNLFRIIQDLS